MLQHGTRSHTPRRRPLLAAPIGTILALVVGLLAATSGAAGSAAGSAVGSAVGSAGDRSGTAAEDGRVPLGTAPYRMKAGTFNILGSQHTRRPGGFAAGHVRAGYTADLINGKEIDVIGLQEVQEDQLRVLGRDLDKYAIWPYRRLGTAQGLRLQIAYKRDSFDLVEAQKIYTRFDGNLRPIPYVRLRDRASGQEFWFMTFHNSPKSMEAERDRATAAEIALVNRLRRTGLPVVIGGDTNEWVEFFCKMARGAAMHSASGGRLRPSCRAAPNPVFDYLMADPRADFFKYRQLGGRVVWRASDHKLVTAKVRLAKSTS